jgi:hypothetical protein
VKVLFVRLGAADADPNVASSTSLSSQRPSDDANRKGLVTALARSTIMPTRGSSGWVPQPAAPLALPSTRSLEFARAAGEVDREGQSVDAPDNLSSERDGLGIRLESGSCRARTLEEELDGGGLGLPWGSKTRSGWWSRSCCCLVFVDEAAQNLVFVDVDRGARTSTAGRSGG